MLRGKKAIFFRWDSDVVAIDSANTGCECYEYYGYRALWRAVIMQAFLDSVNNSSRTEDKIAKSQARSWLLSFSIDFISVCSMAEYSPAYVQKNADRFIGAYEQDIEMEQKHDYHIQDNARL